MFLFRLCYHQHNDILNTLSGVIEGDQTEIKNLDNEIQEVEKEIIGEIIDLIHCFSMKVYSNRRKEKLTLVEKDLRLENDKI